MRQVQRASCAGHVVISISNRPQEFNIMPVFPSHRVDVLCDGSVVTAKFMAHPTAATNKIFNQLL
jgi:hypothetical protein